MKHAELPPIIKNAKARFDLIKSMHPKLDGSLFFGFNGPLIKVNESAINVLLVLPKFFIDSSSKTAAFENNARYKQLMKDGDGKAAGNLMKTIKGLCEDLEINTASTIEIVWDEIDYEVIKAIRSNHDLVDTARTPQVGGIRLVLGTVESFL